MLKSFSILRIKSPVLFACLFLVAQDLHADSDRLLIGDPYFRPESWVKVESASSEIDPVEFASYCSGGKQIRDLRESFSIKLPPTESGLPKNVALKARQAQIQHIKELAKNWFQLGVRPGRMKIHDEYTLFIPPNCKKQSHDACSTWAVAFEPKRCWDTKDRRACEKAPPVPAPSRALEYRAEIWQRYIKEFTTVKVSPSSGGDTFKFEVSLDLNLACRHARPAKDLVTN